VVERNMILMTAQAVVAVLVTVVDSGKVGEAYMRKLGVEGRVVNS